MDFLKILKLDQWYRIVLIIGFASIYASLSFNINFISSRHLFGFGIGCLMTALGFIASEKVINEIAFGGILSTPINKHNFFTKTTILIGVIISIIFGYKIIYNLLY